MTLLLYSLLAGAILSALWLTFRLSGLRRLTHFRFNRFVLIGILLISLALPLIAFRHIDPVVDLTIFPNTVVHELEAQQVEPITVAEHSFDWSWLPMFYIIGTCISALWLLMGLVNVGLAIVKGKKCGRLIIHNHKFAPFTWGRWIIVSESDAENTTVLIHEQAHLNYMHWIDLLLCRCVNCLLWYWPTAWMLSNDLQTIHEYEADRAVIDSGVVPAEYQLMLVHAGAGRLYTGIVNPFNYNSLKNRIIMMKKKSSSSRSLYRALVMLPSAAALILLTSSPALAETVQSYLPSEPAATVETPDEEPVFMNVEVIPQFPGGEASLMTFLKENIRYPEKAYNDGAQGRVVVRFIIEKDGSIGTTTIARGQTPELDAEAMRVVKSMPNFTPGTMNGKPVRVWYMLPILFRITDDNPQPAKDTDTNSEEKVLSADEVIEPQFPGGEAKLITFLNENMRYPEKAFKEGVQGRVIVQFIVEKDGSIGTVKVARGVAPELDAEAIRVVKLLPKFTPGTIKGEPVGIWYTLPITFRIHDDNPQQAKD